MKTWLKGGLVGAIIGLILPWIYRILKVQIFYKLFYMIAEENPFCRGLCGIIFLTIISMIIFFIIGAIIGLIIQKVKK